MSHQVTFADSEFSSKRRQTCKEDFYLDKCLVALLPCCLVAGWRYRDFDALLKPLHEDPFHDGAK